jgi:RND family efflux transporter MFP subunit
MKGYILAIVSTLLLLGARTGAAPVEVIGITEPYEEVTLSAPVSGIVTVKTLKEGDFVQAGAVILELDKRMEELELARRKLVVDLKLSDLESTRRLFKSTKSISKEELEKKEMEYKLAVVEQDMAAEQLRRRVVTSPLSGVITEILLDVGEACQPLTPLAKVVDTRRCYFVANVEPSLGPRCSVDKTLPLQIQAGAENVGLPGKITYSAPIVDAASGLLKVKAIFENPEGKIRPGVAAKLQIE